MISMQARFRCNYRPKTIDDVPLWINVFGPCTQIGRALGLDIDLPNLIDRTEMEALLKTPSGRWKNPFEGSVADIMRNGDYGWIRLADYPFGAAFFDLEEGIKFQTNVANLEECLAFIVSLSDKGVRLWDRDYMEGHGGKEGSWVWVSQAIIGPVPDAEPMFVKVGLVPSGADGLPPWTMPPGWAVRQTSA
jgi:hypothetical protein